MQINLNPFAPPTGIAKPLPQKKNSSIVKKNDKYTVSSHTCNLLLPCLRAVWEKKSCALEFKTTAVSSRCLSS